MKDFCYDGVVLYESGNFVWELILERHNYIAEVVNPTISKGIRQKVIIEGISFGTNY
jgi:hypothetical protein